MIEIKSEQELKEKIHQETYEFLLDVIDKVIQGSIAQGKNEIDKVYTLSFIVESAVGMIGAEIEMSYKIITQKDNSAFIQNDIIKIMVAESPEEIQKFKEEAKNRVVKKTDFPNISLN